MIIEAFTITELGIFIGTCFASVGGLLMSIQKSRCSQISCCGCSCIREVPDIVETEDSTTSNNLRGND